MAKVKSSGLRNYVGALGGSVYYMLKGQNIAREKAPEVANPRTASQMRQRMQWANIVAMYKALQPYLGKKAFQNKPSTWSDYNAFMSANLGADPVYLTKEMVQNGHAILAPYKVTEGSLPSINTGFSVSSQVFDTNVFLARQIDDTATVAELSEAIVENNAGWQYGDQLGIIVMQNGRTYRPYVHAFEIILDNSDERVLYDVTGLEGDFFAADEGNYLSFITSQLPNPTQGLAVACAVIHSRTISGKTSVSTQALVLNPSAQETYDRLRTEDAFNDARESYGIPTEVWLDAGYQGESGGVDDLALRSVSEEGEADGTPYVFMMNAGGKNAFRDPTGLGDVIGDFYLMFRFNKPHGIADNADVVVSFDKGDVVGRTIPYSDTPAIANNYVRIRPSIEFNWSSIINGALTLHLEVNEVDYTISLTA